MECTHTKIPFVAYFMTLSVINCTALTTVNEYENMALNIKRFYDSWSQYIPRTRNSKIIVQNNP